MAVVWWWSLMKVMTLTGGVMLPVVMLKGHVTLMNLPVLVYPIFQCDYIILDESGRVH